MPHRGLGTDNHSPLRGIVGFSSKPQLPKNPGPGSLLALPSMFIVLDEELCSFSIHQRLGEKLQRLWFQAIPGSAKHVHGYRSFSGPQGKPWISLVASKFLQ